ncbi:MAG: glucose-6-phosphate isomerase [Pseudomonadota bacterium]
MSSAAWDRVKAEAARLKAVHLRALIADGARCQALQRTAAGITLDLSREKLDAGAMEALLGLAEAQGLPAMRAALFSGAPINATEGRAVLHMALRGGATPPDGDDVEGTLSRMLAYAEDMRRGPMTDVINIGIGGSDLGPAMAARALRPDCDGPRLHFVSNVDGAHLTDTIAGLDPARTALVVVSKTFTTQETMANAASARDWLEAQNGPAAHRQIAAVSTNIPACTDFGIDPARVFGFWDWVGGRYSLWSSVGLSLAIGIGALRFREMLAGAAAMDAHFREAPLAENLPVLLGLTGLWRRSALGMQARAVIPYDQRLERLPAYLQQLDMESNGKGVRSDGQPVATTGPILFGEPGTNAQHSFFQLLHQGTDPVPVEFLLAARPRETLGAHHAALMANCLAQGQALAAGRTQAEARQMMAEVGFAPAEIARLAPHRCFPGDRPSTTVLYETLDPRTLGAILALYEHRVFVEGAIWGINSFDQWGVELGKELARSLMPIMQGGAADGLDPATAGLVARLRELAP